MQLDPVLKAGYDQLSTRVVVLPRNLGTTPSKVLPAQDGDASGDSSQAPFNLFGDVSHSITVPETSKLMFPHQQYNDEFLRSMSTVVRWSSWCGALGGCGSRAARFWSGCIAALLGVIVVLITERLFRALGGWTLRNNDAAVSGKTAGLVFYLNALGTVALTWRLGSSWRRIIATWAAAERALATHVPQSTALRGQMFTVLAVVSACSLVEHAMSLGSSVGVDCPADELLQRYTLVSHHFLLSAGCLAFCMQKNTDITPSYDRNNVAIMLQQYTWWWGALILAVSNVATVLWNLQDMIIILLSMGLSSRYRRLNTFAAEIVLSCERHSADSGGARGGRGRAPQALWRAAREGFARQAALVRLVDAALGPLVLLSFLNNFYFICLQMYNGISSVEGALQRCYFIISLFWLCARAAGVVLAASAVHYHSRGALTHTFACPSLYYTIEVHRLQAQLSKDTVALTGLHFFEITRSFLLKVAGAIITYEIVLVQFNESACN